MQVNCSGTARIRHNTTHQIYVIGVEELDWQVVCAEEREMGPETQYEAIVDHPKLGELTWSLWEYPIGVENYRETVVEPHALIEDFDYSLRHEAPEPDEWVDYSVPDDPFTIFSSSYHQTGDLLADHGSNHGTHLVNRMIFSHQVTAMEAYLADTLIGEIDADADAFKRLLEQDTDLANEKFTLTEISRDPGLVAGKVREHLRAIQYHNLAKVAVLYRIALGIEILSLCADKASLFRAVKLRHDCVHRNGFDKDGNEITVFTKSFVQETADLIKNLVEGVEKAMRQNSRTRRE